MDDKKMLELNRRILELRTELLLLELKRKELIE